MNPPHVLSYLSIGCGGILLSYFIFWLSKNRHRSDLSLQRAGVVITGGSKGIGLALAVEFLKLGDSVVITGRDKDALEDAIDRINKFFNNTVKVYGKVSDITNEEDLVELVNFASEKLGRIDYWINNAGISQDRRVPLVEIGAKEIKSIIDVNSYGTLLATKIAIQAMMKQHPKHNGRGNVFLMDGAGSQGWGTPKMSVYAMTKASYPQLLKTLVSETNKTGVNVHLLSPGLVLTDLLLRDSDARALKMFNILAEKPSTVAKYLVPRIRGVSNSGRYIRYLTVPGVIFRFATAYFRKNRFFDPDNYRKPTFSLD